MLCGLESNHFFPKGVYKGNVMKGPLLGQEKGYFLGLKFMASDW